MAATQTFRCLARPNTPLKTLLSTPSSLYSPTLSSRSSRPAAAAAAPISQSHPFSTTTHLSVKARERVSQRYGHLPPYPYGYRQWYKKSNFGLFGNARVRFGNNVSERNEIKTRRRWYPNVHRKRLYSVSLGRMVRVKVVARVLRTVDKVGGLDEYLLGNTAARIKELGPGGWALRWRIMRTDAVRARLAAEREALGLVRSGDGRTWVLKKDHTDDDAVEGGDAALTAGGLHVQMDELSLEEEDAGISEAELKAREMAIDRALDEDLAKDEKGLDGGVELEDLDVSDEDKPRRRRW